MGKGRPRQNPFTYLTDVEKGKIIGLADAYKLRGERPNISELARTVGRSRGTIRSVLMKKPETSTKRTGRPRITSKREDRALFFRSLKNRKLTAVELRRSVMTKNNQRPSVRTIRRRLSEMGLNGRVAAKKPLLKKEHRVRRLQWALKYRCWTVKQWRKIIYSDESPFTIYRQSGKIYVRRRSGERYIPSCLHPTLKFGGGKIQVWGCFSYFGVGPLKKIDGKMTGKMYRSILKTHMAPYLRKLTQQKNMTFIFQQDNDPKHTSKVAKNYLRNANIVLLDWPSQSPDLNPIENLWNSLKKKLDNLPQRPSSTTNLFTIAQEEWKKISASELRTLIDSMPRRIEAVIKNKGYPTKY